MFKIDERKTRNEIRRDLKKYFKGNLLCARRSNALQDALIYLNSERLTHVRMKYEFMYSDVKIALETHRSVNKVKADDRAIINKVFEYYVENNIYYANEKGVSF